MFKTIKKLAVNVKAFAVRYWKGCLLVLAMFVCATVAVLGWHWTDTANKPFWWTFWVVAALLAFPFLLLFVHGSINLGKIGNAFECGACSLFQFIDGCL